jgi:DNA-binding transcriptional LysR family regulator
VELRQVRYALVLGEKLHYQRAAADLNITEPTLSQQIKQLEAELGVELFRRNHHHTQLTRAGRAFMATGKRLLSLADRMVEVTSQTARGQTGQITIGAVGSAAVSVIPQVVARYGREYPLVRVTLEEMSTSEQMQALTQGTLDLAYVRPPLTAAADAVVLETLWSEALVAAVGEGHPLARRDRVAIQELSDEPFILFGRRDGPGLHDQILMLCAAAGFLPRIRFEASRVHTILSFVACGLGVTLLPQSLAACGRQGVRALPVDGVPAVIELGVAWNPANDNPCLPAFLALSRDVAAGSRSAV